MGGHALLVLLAMAPSSAERSDATLGRRTSLSVGLERRTVRLSGTAGSNAVHKTMYFGDIAIGETAEQHFSVVFDTGSGNLLVPSASCESEACRIHARFDSEKSKTAKVVNCDGSAVGADGPDSVTITFGTGEITGICLEDQICVGGVCSRGMFIDAEEESSNPFASFKFDGVLGLALPSMSQGPGFSLMSRLAKEDSLQDPIFSVFLSDLDRERSEVTFGEVKKEHTVSNIFWVPVSRDTGYWEVKIDDIAIADKAQSLCEDCRVAVDTGTSQLAGPSDLVDTLSLKLNVKEDCSNYKDLPNLGFIIGDHTLNLEPKDYVNNRGSSCDVSLMSLDVPPPKGPLFVFGIPFLQKYFTAYDLVKRKVGFAVAKHAGMTPRKAASLLTAAPRTVVESSESTHSRLQVSAESRPRGVDSFLSPVRRAGSWD